MTTDTTFFTNDESSTLLDRFKSTLKDVEKFDVLVGYFRTSGFYHLYKELNLFYFLYTLQDLVH